MATITPIMEEATSALPLTVVEGGGMNIILALEISLEASELYALRFLRIALGFCDLVYHTRVHDLHSPYILATTPYPLAVYNIRLSGA